MAKIENLQKVILFLDNFIEEKISKLAKESIIKRTLDGFMIPCILFYIL